MNEPFEYPPDYVENFDLGLPPDPEPPLKPCLKNSDLLKAPEKRRVSFNSPEAEAAPAPITPSLALQRRFERREWNLQEQKESLDVEVTVVNSMDYLQSSSSTTIQSKKKNPQNNCRVAETEELQHVLPTNNSNLVRVTTGAEKLPSTFTINVNNTPTETNVNSSITGAVEIIAAKQEQDEPPSSPVGTTTTPSQPRGLPPTAPHSPPVTAAAAVYIATAGSSSSSIIAPAAYYNPATINNSNNTAPGRAAYSHQQQQQQNTNKNYVAPLSPGADSTSTSGSWRSKIWSKYGTTLHYCPSPTSTSTVPCEESSPVSIDYLDERYETSKTNHDEKLARQHLMPMMMMTTTTTDQHTDDSMDWSYSNSNDGSFNDNNNNNGAYNVGTDNSAGDAAAVDEFLFQYRYVMMFMILLLSCTIMAVIVVAVVRFRESASSAILAAGGGLSHSPTSSPSSGYSVIARSSASPSSAPVVDVMTTPLPTNKQQIGLLPSSRPSDLPSTRPSSHLGIMISSLTPSVYPFSNTLSPSGLPSAYPVEYSNKPSTFPSVVPHSMYKPSSRPTSIPSVTPSVHPTALPSTSPTKFPTNQPTQDPTKYPTKKPTIDPTKYPTKKPTNYPTQNPITNFPFFSDSWEMKMLSIINEERRIADSPPLCYNSKLTLAANRHVKDLAENEILASNGSDGSTVVDRLEDVGYSPRRWAQNTARGFNTVQEVINHYLNYGEESVARIQSTKYEHFGVAEESKYWVILFAGTDDENERCTFTLGPTPEPSMPPTVSQRPSISKPPTISPTSSAAPTYCQDVPGWKDAADYGCIWYGIFDSDCTEYGSCCKKDGHIAKTACCICGGGVNVKG